MSIIRIKTVAVCILIAAICSLSEIKSEEIPNITPQELLKKVKGNYDSHKSISYDVNFRMKFMDHNDTIQLGAKVMLDRELSDTILGGQFYYIAGEHYASYYDLDKYYSIDDSLRKIIEYDPHTGESGIIDGNISSSVIYTYFLKTDRLVIDSSENVKNIEFNYNDGYYNLKFKKPDKEGISENFHKFRINAETLIIENFSNSLKVDEFDEYQYEEWNLSNVIFDKVSLTDLENLLETKKEVYDYIISYPEDDSLDTPLFDGTIAPNFIGKTFSDNSEIFLEKFKGKIVVLDFFFMSCYPCIKAIPHISKIYNEFKDVVVLGINSNNNNEKDLKRLPKFIEKLKFDYPLILTEDSTDKKYNVRGFPTLYVIGKDGKIAFSHIGFSDDLYDKLKEVIEKIK